MLRTDRVKTYHQGDTIAAAGLNGIEDRITETAGIVNRISTISTAESIWVDRSLQDGEATVSTVSVDGFVKLQVGGQVGRLILPGIPDGLALESVQIRCYIPEGNVAFGLWQTVATGAEGLSISHSVGQVTGWPTVTTAGVRSGLTGRR